MTQKSCPCWSEAFIQGVELPGGKEDAPLLARIGAALTTSAIGITVANPSDVVKIRLQACTMRGGGTGS